jgi:hypothetical protein
MAGMRTNDPRCASTGQLSDEDLALLLKELQSRRLIVVQDGKIAYALPPA